MTLKIKYISRQKLRLWQKWSCGADCISDYFSKSQDYWITQVGDGLDDLIQPLLKAGCTLRPGLCPVNFEKLPQMETPHFPQALCPSAFLFHCENSKSFMQVHWVMPSFLSTNTSKSFSAGGLLPTHSLPSPYPCWIASVQVQYLALNFMTFPGPTLSPSRSLWTAASNF